MDSQIEALFYQARFLLERIAMTEQAPTNFGPESSQQQGGHLVQRDSQSDDQARALVSLAGNDMPAVTNFKGEGPDAFRFISKVTGPDVLGADEFPDDGINVKYVYCHGVEISNMSTGEVSDAYRTVLVDDKDVAFGFVSDGVFRSAVDIFKAYKFGEISPPLRVKLGEKKTRSGRRMLMLVAV